MTSTLEPFLAAEVYEHRLEPRRRGPVLRIVLGALDLWCATTGGLLELTRTGDVVVRRRVDGVEELRVPVRTAADSPVLLDLVRDQLEWLTPEEFRAEWGIA